MDIRALWVTAPVSCRCGNATAAWVDPNRGTVQVWARLRHTVRVLGIHNSFLRAGMALTVPHQHHTWRDLHEEVVSNQSDGYLFHQDRRGCWVALIQVGESNDTSWGEPTERPPE